MGIKDIFNSIGKTTGQIKGSLVDQFGPAKYIAAQAPVQYHLPDRGVTVNEEDLNAIRPLIYGEVSNRTPDKQALEANVIVNTALNRVKEYAGKGQNKTVSDVISMPNQYQAYKGNQYQEYFNPSNSLALAKKKQIDAIVDDIGNQIKSGKYADNTSGAYYYAHDPKTGVITYDNQRPLFGK